ncbi:hypothetical protein GCM10008097_26890 [Mycetocola manganoxydans]|nr:hypothetical protein GCM10008097_26890 [Mycetocola manganoxydans]
MALTLHKGLGQEHFRPGLAIPGHDVGDSRESDLRRSFVQKPQPTLRHERRGLRRSVKEISSFAALNFARYINYLPWGAGGASYE